MAKAEVATVTGTTPRRPGPGRPKDPEKRSAILRAARSLFLRHGIEAVTLDMIATEAGTARATLYSHFEGKESLFEAMVAAETDRFAEALRPRPDGAVAPIGELLREYGIRFVTFLSDPEILAFDRLIAAEVVRHPDLARRVVEAGPSRGRRDLASALAGAHARGEVSIDDPVFVAEAFLGMLHGTWHIEGRLGVLAPRSAQDIEDWVSGVVALVLRAHPSRPVA